MPAPHDAQPDRVDLGGFGAAFLVRGDQTAGRFALVEHDIAPRTLAAPVHTHTHEDEYSLVTAGRIGVMIGDEVREAGVGELAPLLPPHRPEPDLGGVVALAQKYGLHMDPSSIGPLVERFGLRA